MAIDIRNIIIGGLVIVITGLIYFGVIKDRKIAMQSNLITASADTIHQYKTKVGSIGAYISTLEGSKQDLLSILEAKKKTDSTNQVLIDSLKKDRNIQSSTEVSTQTNSSYTHKTDTLYRKVNFRDSISTRWYDASVKADSGVSKWHVNTRDELNLTTTLKPNKGIFSGSTLTTYAASSNPDEKVTGVTSVSTIVNKSKITIRPAIGIGLNSDLHGNNIRLGYNAGVVLTFK